VEGLIEPASGPQYTAAVGLALYGARHQKTPRRLPLNLHNGTLGRVGGRVRAWFAEMF
jgi:hypothetical protein